jgi:hypothetical protein
MPSRSAPHVNIWSICLYLLQFTLYSLDAFEITWYVISPEKSFLFLALGEHVMFHNSSKFRYSNYGGNAFIDTEDYLLLQTGTTLSDNTRASLHNTSRWIYLLASMAQLIFLVWLVRTSVYTYAIHKFIGTLFGAIASIFFAFSFAGGYSIFLWGFMSVILRFIGYFCTCPRDPHVGFFCSPFFHSWHLHYTNFLWPPRAWRLTLLR